MSDTQQGAPDTLYEESRAWVSEEPEAAVRTPLFLCMFAVLVALVTNTIFLHPQNIDTDASQGGRAPAGQEAVVRADQDVNVAAKKTPSAATNQNVHTAGDRGSNKQTEEGGFAQLTSAKDNELMTAAISQLGVLFVVALFLERALEIYVSTWRQGRAEALEVLRDNAAAVTAGNGVGQDGPQVQELETRLRRYKAYTRQLTTSIAIIAATLVALCGPRLLEGVFKFVGETPTEQRFMFESLDILLTAGLIGGGSAAFHPMITSITEFFQASQMRLKQTSA